MGYLILIGLAVFAWYKWDAIKKFWDEKIKPEIED